MHILPHEHGLYVILPGIPVLTLPIKLKVCEGGLPLDFWWVDLAQGIFNLSKGLPRLILISFKLMEAVFLGELPDAALFFKGALGCQSR